MDLKRRHNYISRIISKIFLIKEILNKEKFFRSSYLRQVTLKILAESDPEIEFQTLCGGSVTCATAEQEAAGLTTPILYSLVSGGKVRSLAPTG